MREKIEQLKALLEREQQENKWIREANKILQEENRMLKDMIVNEAENYNRLSVLRNALEAEKRARLKKENEK